MILLNGIFINLFDNLIVSINIVELKQLSKLVKLFLKLGLNRIKYK